MAADAFGARNYLSAHAELESKGDGLAWSDDTQALLRVNTRIKFGPDAPEMDACSARMYVLDDDGKVKIEHVIFFLS